MNLDENRRLARSRSNASVFHLGDCELCPEETEVRARNTNVFCEGNVLFIFSFFFLLKFRFAHEKKIGFYFFFLSKIDLGDTEDSGNFESTFDRLGLESSRDGHEGILPPFADRGTQTCGCQNCFESGNELVKGIKSREISTMKLVVQKPEILNYQVRPM